MFDTQVLRTTEAMREQMQHLEELSLAEQQEQSQGHAQLQELSEKLQVIPFNCNINGDQVIEQFGFQAGTATVDVACILVAILVLRLLGGAALFKATGSCSCCKSQQRPTTKQPTPESTSKSTPNV